MQWRSAKIYHFSSPREKNETNEKSFETKEIVEIAQEPNKN